MLDKCKLALICIMLVGCSVSEETETNSVRDFTMVKSDFDSTVTWMQGTQFMNAKNTSNDEKINRQYWITVWENNCNIPKTNISITGTDCGSGTVGGHVVLGNKQTAVQNVQPGDSMFIAPICRSQNASPSLEMKVGSPSYSKAGGVCVVKIKNFNPK
ncbi:hypothetical protein ACIL2U_002166 [Vibrio alginolyticus]